MQILSFILAQLFGRFWICLAGIIVGMCACYYVRSLCIQLYVPAWAAYRVNAVRFEAGAFDREEDSTLMSM